MVGTSSDLGKCDWSPKYLVPPLKDEKGKLPHSSSMTTIYINIEDFALASVDLKWCNAGSFLPRTHGVESGDLNVILTAIVLELQNAVQLLLRSHRMRVSCVEGCGLATTNLKQRSSSPDTQVSITYSRGFCNNSNNPRSAGHRGNCSQFPQDIQG